MRRKGLAVVLSMCLVFGQAVAAWANGDEAPPVSGIDKISGVYAGPELTIRLTANEAGTVYYTLDGTEPTAANNVGSGSSAGVEVTLPTGYHTVAFRTRDDAGNWEPYTNYTHYKVTASHDELSFAVVDYGTGGARYTRFVQADGGEVLYANEVWTGEEWAYRELYLLGEGLLATTDFDVAYTAMSGFDIVYGNETAIYRYSLLHETNELIYESGTRIKEVKLHGGTVVFLEEATLHSADLKLNAIDLDAPATVVTLNGDPDVSVTASDEFDVYEDFVVWEEGQRAYMHHMVLGATVPLEGIAHPDQLAISRQWIYVYQDGALQVLDLTDPTQTIRTIVPYFPYVNEMKADKSEDSAFVVVSMYDTDTNVLAAIDPATGGMKYLDLEGSFSSLLDFAVYDGTVYWSKEHYAYDDAREEVVIPKTPLYMLDLNTLAEDVTPPAVALLPNGGEFARETAVRMEASEDAIVYYAYGGQNDPFAGFSGTVRSLIPIMMKEEVVAYQAVDFAGNKSPVHVSNTYRVENGAIPIVPLRDIGGYAVYGSKLVYANDSAFHLYDIAARKSAYVMTDARFSGGLDFDGKTIVYTSGSGIAYYDLPTGASGVVNDDSVWSPSVHDGKIVYVKLYDELFLYDLATGEKEQLVYDGSDDFGWFSGPTMNDAHVLVRDPGQGTALLYHIGSGHWTDILAEAIGEGIDVSEILEAVLASDSVFFVGEDAAGDESLYRYDIAGGATVRLTQSSDTTDIDGLSYDKATGKYVAGYDWDNAEVLIYDMEEEQLARFGDGNLNAYWPLITGQTLVFSEYLGLPAEYLWIRHLAEDAEPPAVRFEPAPGAYRKPVTVALDVYGDDVSTIYYTLDGSEPTRDSDMYVVPFTLEDSATVKALAVDLSGNASPVATARYVIDAEAPRVNAAPAGGAYREPVTVALSSNEPDATIYYSIDGSEPSVTWSVYEQTNGLRIAANTVLKYKAVDAAGNESIVHSETYLIDPDAPQVTASPPGGLYHADVTVTFDVYDTSGVTIYYTLDGSEPSEASATYSGPFTLRESADLKYIAVDAAGNATGVVTVRYEIVKVAPSGTPLPASGAVGVGVDSPIRVTFDTDVTAHDLSGIALSANGQTVGGVTAELAGRVLDIAHGTLAYGQEYTVIVPADAVRNEHGIGNEAIVWRFTTQQAVVDNGNGNGGGNGGGNNSGNNGGNGSPSNADGPSTAPPRGIRTQADGSVSLEGGALTVSRETTDDGRTQTTVAVDAASLAQAFATLRANGTDKRSVTIDLAGGADSTLVRLPGAAFAAAEADRSGLVVSIRTPEAGYELPAGLLDAASWAEALGASPEDVTFTLRLEKMTGAAADDIERRAGDSGMRLVGSPFAFSLLVEANGQSRAFDSFGATYVSRTIALADTAEGAVLSAVVYDPATGGMSFVPAVVSETDGGLAMTIKRNGNSVYAVVAGNKTFADAHGHWAQSEIELLASKMLINGVGGDRFAPEQAITRAEFAALLARGLGLAARPATAAYADVATDDWFASAVAAAGEAGLIRGFADGTFRPHETITREEMGVMIARALTFTGYGGQANPTMSLAPFGDRAQIGEWARAELALSVRAGIIAGMPDGQFAPASSATRAEAAVMLKRLLQHIDFID